MKNRGNTQNRFTVRQLMLQVTWIALFLGICRIAFSTPTTLYEAAAIYAARFMLVVSPILVLRREARRLDEHRH